MLRYHKLDLGIFQPVTIIEIHGRMKEFKWVFEKAQIGNRRTPRSK